MSRETILANFTTTWSQPIYLHSPPHHMHLAPLTSYYLYCLEITMFFLVYIIFTLWICHIISKDFTVVLEWDSKMKLLLYAYNNLWKENECLFVYVLNNRSNLDTLRKFLNELGGPNDFQIVRKLVSEQSSNYSETNLD